MSASTMIGSQIPILLTRLNAPRALVILSAWNRAKVAFVSGILAARLNPEAVSCCLAVWINGPRLRVTVLFWSVTAPPPVPVSALTSAAWAWRLACTQALANAGLLVILATSVWVKLWTPLATGTVKGLELGDDIRGQPLLGQRVHGL